MLKTILFILLGFNAHGLLSQSTQILNIQSIDSTTNYININFELKSNRNAVLLRAYFKVEGNPNFIELLGLEGDFGIIKNGRDHQLSIPSSSFKSNKKIALRFTIERIPDFLESFAWIPGGKFVMGSDNGDEDAQPAHPVSVNNFYIQKYETTVSEYRMYLAQSNESLPEEQIEWLDQHPMTFVSWYDAQEYISWLNTKYLVNEFKLPTEAEWEYSAKSMKANFVYSGSDNVNDVGWYKTNSVGAMHSQVGQMAPNNFGIFDMTGNVWEWCEDWYSSKYYAMSPSVNPDGPRVGKVKVGRGGSWYHSAVPVSFRYFMTPTAKTNYVGFRVAFSDNPSYREIIDDYETPYIYVSSAKENLALQTEGKAVTIKLINPAPMSINDTIFIIDSSIDLTGEVDDPSQTLLLLVNGNETHIDDDGYFKVEIPVHYLLNEISIKAISRSNKISESILKIYRAPSNADLAGKSNKLKRNDYAIFFATDSYDDFPDLINPINDVSTIERELKNYYGFETEKVINPDLNTFYSNLRELSKRKYSDQDQLLIFIAGHGEFDNLFGDGYLVMRDSRKNDKNRTSFVSQSNLRNIINNIKCNHIMVVMDACFSGTFDPLIAKRGGDIYENVNKVEFINRKLKYKTRLYITSGGKEYVPDGRSGAHSPFVRNFLEAIRDFGGEDKVITFGEVINYIEKTKPEPRFGEFGDNEPGSDFLFISKY